MFEPNGLDKIVFFIIPGLFLFIAFTGEFWICRGKFLLIPVISEIIDDKLKHNKTVC